MMRNDQQNPFEQDEMLRQLRTQDSATRSPKAAVAVPGIQAPIPVDTLAPDAPATPEKSAASSVFQSDNQNGRGYLEEATRAYAPTLQGIKDEGEREAAVENYLRSLVPELQKRGLNVGDIKKEKMQLDGKWVDLYRDVTNGRGSGAAEAQYLEDDGGGGAPMGMPGAGGPSSVQGIQSLVPTDTNTYNTLQRRLAEILGGPQALERDALLNQLRG